MTSMDFSDLHISMPDRARIFMSALWFWTYVMFYVTKCINVALRIFITYTPDSMIIFRHGTKSPNKINPPKITLVVVNKRINQRMFCEERGQVMNRPPGTIIDNKLVENTDNSCFDFFLVPQ